MLSLSSQELRKQYKQVIMDHQLGRTTQEEVKSIMQEIISQIRELNNLHKENK